MAAVIIAFAADRLIMGGAHRPAGGPALGQLESRLAEARALVARGAEIRAAVAARPVPGLPAGAPMPRVVAALEALARARGVRVTELRPAEGGLVITLDGGWQGIMTLTTDIETGGFRVEQGSLSKGSPTGGLRAQLRLSRRS